ncbi:MAG TPA: SMP-30/gluconolactonase/LRE family protein [Planctomycetaceae bacterium]|nr:SMP-30/gluconolactonase/LRE family protein [Planctomycetaceae bacterium]
MVVRTIVAVLLAATLVQSATAADVATLIQDGVEVRKVVGDCKFTEGPAYSPKGFLVFSDIPNSRIVRVDEDGSASDFLKPSGNSNGLMYDAAGHLYVCQGGARRVVRISAVDGKLETLCEQYEGKKLNSPNDLALDYTGGLYFTDPRYGSNDGVEQAVMGVYYIDPQGKTTRVIDSLQRPNGVLVSANGQQLIVAEPNKREVWMYPISGPGKVGEGKIIYTGDEKLDGGGPDGMALDADGRIYCTYKSVVVLNPTGELIGRIPVPEQPANCKFGGADGKTLFITARTSVYSLAMTVAGAAYAANGPRPAAQVTRKSREIPVRLVAQEKAAAEEKKIGDIKLKIPADWKEQPPANRLRLAQFAIPAAEGDKDPGELVVSFFQGDGGGVDPNLKRWNDQFTGEDKKIKLTEGECPQGKYYFSDVSGTYLKPIGPPIAGKKEPTPGYRSIGIILQVKEQGNYFLRLTGPDKTITAATEKFRQTFGGDSAKEKAYELQ